MRLRSDRRRYEGVQPEHGGRSRTAEGGDLFAEAVTFLDGDHDGRADLVVGAPGENSDAGSVWGFGSGASGVTATGSVSFGARVLGTGPRFARLGAEFTR